MLKRRESKLLQHFAELTETAAKEADANSLAAIATVLLLTLKAFPALQVDDALEKGMDHLGLMIDEAVKADPSLVEAVDHE